MASPDYRQTPYSPDWIEGASQVDTIYRRGMGDLGDMWTFDESGSPKLRAGTVDGKKVVPVPAGSFSRQEYRKELDRIRAEGGIPVEAPEKFTRGKGTSERDRVEGFYNEKGQSMGTMVGRGQHSALGGKGGKNTQQTNWSDYVGDNPNSGRAGTCYYRDSSVWREGGTGSPDGHTGTGTTLPRSRQGETVIRNQYSGPTWQNSIPMYQGQMSVGPQQKAPESSFWNLSQNQSAAFPSSQPNYWSNYY